MSRTSMGMFGTDGIRARAGTGPLALANVLAIGRILGAILRERGSKARPRVLVGRDTRESGPAIERVLVAGLESAGVEVALAGVLPTPGVATLVLAEGFDLGVAVSASHNPFEDNGIKVFDGRGRKIPREFEDEIEARFVGQAAPEAIRAPGPVTSDPEAANRYLETLLADPEVVGTRAAGVAAVVDCANGAAALGALGSAFGRLGIEVDWLADRPDGTNINQGCGATDPEAMRRRVVQVGAHLGMSFDGDADRVVLADEEGRLVDGDALLAIFAADLASRGRLAVPIVVGTVMSNFGLESGLAEAGIELVRTGVGDRLVAERMAESGAVLGGEPSGHVIFGDRGGLLTGDGIYTALRAIALMARTAEKSLGRLAAVYRHVPQVQHSVKVSRRTPFEEVSAVREELDRAARELGSSGRVLVRYSGTENVARVMVEGLDGDLVRRLAERLAAAVGRALA